MSKIARLRAHLLAASLLAMAPVAEPATLSVTVGISVRFLSSSGVCAAEQAQVGLSVVCERPRLVTAGGLLPTGWQATVAGVAPSVAADLLPAPPESRQMVPMPIGRNLYEALPVRTTGVEISGWRLVSSDNGSYVELTVAW